jgi:hypothetical protein
VMTGQRGLGRKRGCRPKKVEDLFVLGLGRSESCQPSFQGWRSFSGNIAWGDHFAIYHANGRVTRGSIPGIQVSSRGRSPGKRRDLKRRFRQLVEDKGPPGKRRAPYPGVKSPAGSCGGFMPVGARIWRWRLLSGQACQSKHRQKWHPGLDLRMAYSLWLPARRKLRGG